MENKRTIGNVTAGIMIAFALIADGLQFLFTLSVVLIPLSLLLTFFTSTGFILWFFILGAYRGKGAEKRVLISAISSIIELVPIINAIPAVTAGVIVNIVLSRAKDLEKRIGTDPKKAAALARLRKMQAARAARTSIGRESREAAQQARHGGADETA